MLKFKTPSGTAEIENCWDELTTAQFIETVNLTNRFVAGEFSLTDYRLCLLQMLTGYQRKPGTRNPKPETVETINENLFRISELLNFAIRPQAGPAEVLEFFTPALREALKNRFPWEIHEPEFTAQLAQMKNTLQLSYLIDTNIGRNPIPFISVGETVLKGPEFTVTPDELSTTLRAGAYLDAHEYFMAYAKTQNRKYIERLIMCLYSPTDAENHEDYPQFSDLKLQDAVAFVFLFIEKTLAADPVFSVLYQNADTQPVFTPGKIDLGPDGVIAQLVTAGFGTYQSIVELDVRTFFNMQIMLIRRAVETMRAYKKNTAEIARELNLSTETILKL